MGMVATMLSRCGRWQLPQPLGSSLAREPCMEKIHVVGNFFRPQGFLSWRATQAVRPQGSLARELAPQRLRELPSAAAQPQ